MKHKHQLRDGDEAGDHQTQSDALTVARVFVRRNASDSSLQELREFLRQSAVGGYSITQSGSPRSGYWTSVDLTDRRDLDRVREAFRNLIDAWKDLS